MYFPVSELHGWGKRSAALPQTIYSEFPKVFLLSIKEAEKYFPSDESRKCAPTAYAKVQGANTSDSNKTVSGEATCWWWLRTPGHGWDNAAVVDDVGSVDYIGRSASTNGCVRPAMWINLGF